MREPTGCTAAFRRGAWRERGDIGGVVPLLPVGHDLKRRLCVKDPLGQDCSQEHLHLQDG
jgi:hypothetical protein